MSPLQSSSLHVRFQAAHAVPTASALLVFGEEDMVGRFRWSELPALAASPSIELDVADLTEAPTAGGGEPDWTDAQANTIFDTGLTLAMDVGGYSITFLLSNPQLAAFPTPGETNSYRTNTLKFQGIPSSTNSVMIWSLQND